jgi:hypothetical protein
MLSVLHLHRKLLSACAACRQEQCSRGGRDAAVELQCGRGEDTEGSEDALKCRNAEGREERDEKQERRIMEEGSRGRWAEGMVGERRGAAEGEEERGAIGSDPTAGQLRAAGRMQMAGGVAAPMVCGGHHPTSVFRIPGARGARRGEGEENGRRAAKGREAEGKGSGTSPCGRSL